MVLVILGMLLALALALVVVGLVAIPAVRDGESLLSDGRARRAARPEGDAQDDEVQDGPASRIEGASKESVGATR